MNFFEIFGDLFNGKETNVKVDDKISSEETVDYGVPEGTVLGPILLAIPRDY